MRILHLIRPFSPTPQGTRGLLVTSTGFNCKTIELPWHDNKSNISCIPAGVYSVKIRISPRYGKIYWITNVQSRSWILIHSGNFAGDRSLGFRSNVAGCVLLGLKFGTIYGQQAVLNSRVAVRRFMKHMNYKPFMLYIHGGESS